MIDTSIYVIVRGEALRKAKGKEPRAIDNEGRSIGEHKHGPNMPRAIAPHKQIDASKWLTLATAKGDDSDSRPALGIAWQMGSVALAADGYRLHIVQGIVAGAIPGKAGGKYEGEHIIPDYLSLVNRKGEHRATFSTDAMHRALHVVKPFTYDSANIVGFEFESDECVLRATSHEMGDARATLDVQSTGAFAFALNCKYVLEMLSGMGEQTEIRVQGEFKPVYFVSGVREGMLMPMCIN